MIMDGYRDRTPPIYGRSDAVMPPQMSLGRVRGGAGASLVLEARLYFGPRIRATAVECVEEQHARLHSTGYVPGILT